MSNIDVHAHSAYSAAVPTEAGCVKEWRSELDVQDVDAVPVAKNGSGASPELKRSR
jgi:hypothetical protein